MFKQSDTERKRHGDGTLKNLVRCKDREIRANFDLKPKIKFCSSFVLTSQNRLKIDILGWRKSSRYVWVGEQLK